MGSFCLLARGMELQLDYKPSKLQNRIQRRPMRKYRFTPDWSLLSNETQKDPRECCLCVEDSSSGVEDSSSGVEDSSSGIVTMLPRGHHRF